MGDANFTNFRNIVSDVISTAKSDPVLHILVLTYEFDEQQLVNLVTRNNLEDELAPRLSQLKILSDMRPLVIYDARKTKEFSNIPQFLELHPYKTGGYSCHHSKAYLLVTENTIRLVLGSFNLTATGLFKNREVFEYFYWDADYRNDSQILVEWIQFLEDHYESRLFESSSKSALSEIVLTLKKRANDWTMNDQSNQMHLLFSGYSDPITGAGLTKLKNLWEEWFPNSKPDSLLVVSPFFDQSTVKGCIASELLIEFPEIEKMTLVTDQIAFDGLSKAHFGGVKKGELLLIPTELSDEELQRIKHLARQANNSIKDQNITRKLHAKILVLFSKQDALIYVGSANFSGNAWLGANRELGVVFKERYSDKLKMDIIAGVSAALVDHYDSLPMEPNEDNLPEDDEAFEDLAHFPDFIECIHLVPNEDQSAVQFQFEFGKRLNWDEKKSLNEYLISWAGIDLIISNTQSQWIEKQQFQSRLIGGRNLRFQCAKSKESIFWFPFQYGANLIQERESYLHRSSLDWMEFYIHSEEGPPLIDGEYIPGEGEDTGNINVSEIDLLNRENNCVIAMQRYLSLFSRVEHNFYLRAKEIRSLSDSLNEKMVQEQIINPLMCFSSLLRREFMSASLPDKSNTVESTIFKFGELLQMVNRLKKQFVGNAGISFAPLQKQIRLLLKELDQKKTLHSQYIKFIIESGAHE